MQVGLELEVPAVTATALIIVATVFTSTLIVIVRASVVALRLGVLAPPLEGVTPNRLGKFSILIHVYGYIVHGVLFAFGLLCSVSGSAFFAAHGADDGFWSSLGEATGVVFTMFSSPFFAVALPRPRNFSTSAICCALLIIGTFLSMSASLGLATLRRQPGRAVLYATFAAVLLAWILHCGLMLRELSEMEDLGQDISSLTQLQQMKRQIFKEARGAFAQLYKGRQCKVIQQVVTPLTTPLRISCNMSTIEGRITQAMVQGFCGDSLRTDGFPHRVDTCLTGGVKLGLLSEGIEHDIIFCQCWLACFDMLALESWCYLGMWGILLYGVIAVLYTAAEPALNRMCDQQWRDVCWFLIVGITGLVCKSLFFTKVLPSAV